ncbi:hypothetical protein O181_062450 [Austropuccinia psidii MF-1]|uniref:Uncharacterized protein n=1 Tax=Austropuccinia psidii MF-1 TaxID=1389203 RepID=A0A9Q3EH04_9BASI|nr:hypothetical protein [Austropuccinia psidii MF-1]
MPTQELVQNRKRRGVGNILKPLEGDHELLLTLQELSGSGEDHRAPRRGEPIVLQRRGQKDKELVEKSKSFIHTPEEGTGNDSSFGEGRPSGIYQLQTSFRSVQIQAQWTSEERERSQETSGQGQRQSQLAQTLPTMIQGPQIGAFSHGQCLQYGQNSHGIYFQSEGKNEKDLYTKKMQEIIFLKSSIDLELGKFNAKLNKIISDLSELERNDKTYTEWYKLTNIRIYSITSTCDIIESKCQVQEDEIGDISILHINEQPAILRS